MNSSRSFSAQPLRWGILGTGNIAKTFARGVRASQTGALVAVGSRSQESADGFADEFEIATRHASYEALLADAEVEAIYVATPLWAQKRQRELGLNPSLALGVRHYLKRMNFAFCRG